MQGNAARSAFWPAPTIGFDHLRLATKTICRCPSRSTARSWPEIDRIRRMSAHSAGCPSNTLHLRRTRPRAACCASRCAVSVSPRCVVEAAGTHTDHAAARLAVHPARTIRAYEPSVEPTAIRDALKRSRFTRREAESSLRQRDPQGEGAARDVLAVGAVHA